MKSVFDLKSRTFREAKKHEEHMAVEFPGGGGGGVVYANFTVNESGKWVCDCTNEDIFNAVEGGKIVVAKKTDSLDNSYYLPLYKVSDKFAYFAGVIADDGGGCGCQWVLMNVYSGVKEGNVTLKEVAPPM